MLVSERELGRPDGVELVERILQRAAPSAIHLRARLNAATRFEIARRLSRVARRTRGWLVVNGRPDIALAAGADAVQLGRTSLGVAETRALVRACGGALAIGASVHDAGSAAQAVRAGADYLVLGTIYPTSSHPGVEGSGPAAIAELRTRLSERRPTPILAIGGICVERVGEVVNAGAHGVVVGRGVWAAADPLEAACALRRALRAGPEETEETEADVG